jgi:hypothetical protein
MRMKVACTAVLAFLIAAPAYAQDPIPRYGEKDKEKSPQEMQDEREVQKAYKRSLNNIPDRGPTDPWGSVRSDSPPKASTKAATKATPAKRAKAGGAAN